MPVSFKCTNCDTIIELENPSTGLSVECPTCFTIHNIRSVNPPELAYVKDSFNVSDSAMPVNNVPPVSQHSPSPSTSQPDQVPKQYLCVPFNGFTKSDDSTPGITLANQLEEILNEYHRQGWQFYRVDTLRVFVQPGCFASLFGNTTEQRAYDVVIFVK